MAKLVWNQIEQNRYEFGVDRGVFYPTNDVGVVWNGLVSVNESSDGGANNSYHYDGIKYLDSVQPRNYQMSISTYSTPSQFRSAQGERTVVPGFILTRQPRDRFGLCYRTFVGPDLGYKIHIVYNALASPTRRNHVTISDSADPALLSWKIDAVPPVRSKYRPSAHYILDSLTMPADILETLEDILYGTEETPPRLPDPGEIENIITLWTPLIIMEQTVTGLAELVPGMGDIYRTDKEGFHRALPDTRLQMTSVSGIYRLE
jgi:hypothetical protein